MATKVLIVEDETNIAELLHLYLEKEGFETAVAGDGGKAVELFRSFHPELVLLDIMLPVMDGWSVLKKIRESDKTPVIMLTARDTVVDKVSGLDSGADDYITKPFRPLVLGAKVKALIRRNKNMVLDHSDVLDCGPFTYNTSTMRFYKGEKEISLSSKENSLMLLFMKHPGQVFTKDMIYEHVWGTSVAVDDNAIMVYINRLRGKIEEDRQKPEHIVTVRGLGYRFIP